MPTPSHIILTTTEGAAILIPTRDMIVQEITDGASAYSLIWISSARTGTSLYWRVEESPYEIYHMLTHHQEDT